MSQPKRISEMIKTKLNLIRLQNAELHDLMNRFVDKESKEAEKTIRTSGQNADELKKVNLKLESVINLLFKTYESFESHLENVPTLEQGKDLLTSSAQKTASPHGATSVATEFNRRLESLELSASSQREQSNNLELATDLQQKKLKVLEVQVTILQDALKTSVTRHASEMEAIKLQRDDMEDSMVNQIQNLKHLQEVVQGKETIYFDILVSKKDFVEVLEWRNKAEKRLEQLVTTSEALEYDVKNVMDWHKELDNEVKQTFPKLKEVETRVQGCNDMLHNEKQSLHKLEQRLVEKEGSIGKGFCQIEQILKEELEKLTSAQENVKTSFHLTCQLIANKLLPLRQLQETSRNTLNEFLLKRKEFETKVSQFMTSSEAEVTLVKSKLNVSTALIGTSAHAYLTTGFTAFLRGYYNFDDDQIVKPYRDTDLSVFDSNTGEFKAPCDGLYLSFMTINQNGDGQIRAHVCRLPGLLNSHVKLVCKGKTNKDEGSCCSAGCIRLYAGERLAMRVIRMDEDVKLTPYTSFTCCLVAIH